MPSQRIPGTPKPSPRRCRSVTAEWRSIAVPMPNWLLVTMKTTGSFQSAARLSVSPNRPRLAGPAPDRPQGALAQPLVVGGERHPGGQRQVAADDPVAAHEAVLEVEHVHRAAAAVRDAVLAPEQLGDHAVGVRPAGQRVPVRAV